MRNDFCNSLTSSESISNMVALIAFDWSVLLLYCLPPSYNFIFKIDQVLLIGFRSGLDGSYSIIFSPANLSCSKNLRVSFVAWEGAWTRIKSYFTSKVRNWDFYHTNKFLSMKSQYLPLLSLTRISSLNSSIMVWSIILGYIITLVFLCCLLLATGTFELGRIHLLACQSNYTPSLSNRITWEKSVFLHFLAQFWQFEYLLLWEEGLVCWVLWHINLCRLFNAKSILCK